MPRDAGIDLLGLLQVQGPGCVPDRVPRELTQRTLHTQGPDSLMRPREALGTPNACPWFLWASVLEPFPRLGLLWPLSLESVSAGECADTGVRSESHAWGLPDQLPKPVVSLRSHHATHGPPTAVTTHTHALAAAHARSLSHISVYKGKEKAK